jgi:hypothetical protein
MSEHPAEEPTFTEDHLLGGRIRLKQPAAGYRVAIDPVFLSAAVPAEPHQLVLDVGCVSIGLTRPNASEHRLTGRPVKRRALACRS